MVELVTAPIEPDVEQVDETKLWRVFFLRDDAASGGRPVWVDLGSVQSEYTWGLYGDDYQRVGDLAGSGDYMLVRADLHSAKLFSLRATTTYEVIEDDDDESGEAA